VRSITFAAFASMAATAAAITSVSDRIGSRDVACRSLRRRSRLRRSNPPPAYLRWTCVEPGFPEDELGSVQVGDLACRERLT
jgi:hypothetical protein